MDLQREVDQKEDEENNRTYAIFLGNDGFEKKSELVEFLKMLDGDLGDVLMYKKFENSARKIPIMRLSKEKVEECRGMELAGEKVRVKKW